MAKPLVSWEVQIALPEGKLNKFAEWLLGAGVAHAGGPHGMGGLMNSGMKWLYGGTPIAGTLTLDAEYLRFVPSKFATALYYETAPSLEIPLDEINSAKAAPSFLGVSANLLKPSHLTINTSRGAFDIYSFSLFSRPKSIARRIEEAMAAKAS